MTGDAGEREGLTAVHGPIVEGVEGRPRWTPGRIAAQAAGGLVGLALLAWVVALTTRGENAGAWRAVADAPAWAIASVALVTAVGVVINGLMFWVTARPVARLGAVDVIAVNSIGTLLSILPFKLGLLVRLLIHRRHDRLAYRDLIAWMMGAAALGAALMGPVALATLWRGTFDAWWWLAGPGGAVACTLAGVAVSRAASDRGWIRRLGLGAHRVARDLRVVLAHGALRSVDVALLGARFWVAGVIAGVDISPGDALLLGSCFVLITVASPVGSLGFAEMGTAGLGALIGLPVDEVGIVVLVARVAETGVTLAMSAWGWRRLRVGRLLFRRSAPVSPAPPA